MALRQYMTLGEMRSEVLRRCGLGYQAELQGDLYPQIEGDLRKWQKRLWVKYGFLRSRTRQLITMTAGLQTYDIPDVFDPGSIDRVQASTTDGKLQWNLEQGITALDRALQNTTNSTAGYEPSRYDIFDGQITVNLAPTATVTLLYLEGQLAPGRLSDDTDRPTVDDEALIQHATVDLKAAKNIPLAKDERELATEYVMELEANEGTGEGFQPGSTWQDPEAAPVLPPSTRPWWLANRRP